MEEAQERWNQEGKALFEANRHLGREHWRDNGLCPVCNGYGSVSFRRKDGHMYSATERICWICPCARHWWFRKEIEKWLPPALRGASLATLRPHHLSTLGTPAEQQAEIGFLKAHRHDGFVFLGPAGSSKSTFAAALLANAIGEEAFSWMDGRHIWRIDGREFFEREHEWATAGDKDEVERLITAGDIRRARRRGFRPVLVMEELDKRRMTEFAADALFGIVNAMDEDEGQLILTTNLTVDGFAKLFSASDSEPVRACGEALCRRLFKCETKGMNVRNYWK